MKFSANSKLDKMVKDQVFSADKLSFECVINPCRYTIFSVVSIQTLSGSKV